jgi:hypothetical protein
MPSLTLPNAPMASSTSSPGSTGTAGSTLVPSVEPVLADTPAPAPLKLSPEVEAVVYRFTHGVGGNTVHDLAESTGFPSALASLHPGAAAPRIEGNNAANLPPPTGLTADGNSTELVVRDWTGIVLVPVSAALAKAYTSEVRLLKVEAHPLHDGRLRIWARIRNVSSRPLPAEIACSFRMRGENTPNSPYFYQLDVPPGAFRDVFFVSPEGELSAYAVLVRSEEMWKR